MNPSKAERNRTHRLTDLPNVGPAMARHLESIGIRTPGDLDGRDPLALYEALCFEIGYPADPCVLDVFMSITDFMDGNGPRPWWEYTAERKRRYGGVSAARQ